MRLRSNDMANSFRSVIPAVESYLFEPQRLAACAVAFVIAYAVVAAVWLGDGFQPVDFTAFWGASWLTLHDTPTAIFDVQRMAYAHTIAIPNSTDVYHWLYPPTYLLIILPLAFLPYALSFGAWTVSTFAAYAWALSKIAAPRWVFMGLLAFPGTLMNVLTGQNGLFLASLFTAASCTLERRPIVAGVFIGLMSVKPQIGVLWPVALICGRHWLALAAAAATTAFLALAALIGFGPEPWLAFAHSVAAVQQGFDGGLVSWIKIPTLYGGGRLLGLDRDSAYLIQFVVAAGVAITVGVIWSRQVPITLRASVLAIATLLVLPRLLVYDLALLALPLTLLTVDGIKRGWRSYERPLLVLAWLTPLLGLVVALATGIHVTPLILIALLLIAVRRSLAASTSDGDTRPPVLPHKTCSDQP